MSKFFLFFLVCCLLAYPDSRPFLFVVGEMTETDILLGVIADWVQFCLFE